MNNASCRLFINDPVSGLRYLIDSGSDVSAIPASKFKTSLRKPDQSLCAANGSSIDVFGTKFMRISLGFRRNFENNFLVASVTKPIIGADFLRNSGLLIDIKNNRLIDPTTKSFVEGIRFNGNFDSLKFFSIEHRYDEILKKFPE